MSLAAIAAIYSLFAFAPLPSEAAKYRWTDASGNAHVSDTPPPVFGAPNAPAGPVDILEGDSRTMPVILQPVEWMTKDPKGPKATALASAELLKASKGDAWAQNNAGAFSLWGYGTEPSRDDAIYWLSKAADQGIASPATLLGAIYSGAAGGEPDYDTAFRWYEHSAKKGDRPAQEALARMYLNGHGVQRDARQSLYWLREATKSGVAGYEKVLDLTEKLVRAEDKVEEARRAKTWVPADQNAITFQKSPWDGSVRSVKEFLDARLDDPYSIKFVEWGEILTNGTTYRIAVRYRAKNAFGAYRLNAQWFYFTSTGEVVSVESIE